MLICHQEKNATIVDLSSICDASSQPSFHSDISPIDGDIEPIDSNIASVDSDASAESLPTDSCDIPDETCGFGEKQGDVPLQNFVAEMGSLAEGEELYDHVVNALAQQLVSRMCFERNYFVVPIVIDCAFQSSEYTQIIQCLYENEGLNRDAIYVVMPSNIHTGIHWMAGVINFKDSLHFSTIAKTLLQHLAKMVFICHDIGNEHCMLEEWKFICSTDCPKQTNSIDCGLYTAGYYLYGILIAANKNIE